jgi:hypothetical protein
MKCKKDGGLCGVGGYCDKCPVRGNDMSITIEDVLEWTKWRDHGAQYPRSLEKSMRSAQTLFAELAISQYEELESLRAQLAEKDAMLDHLATTKPEPGP